MGSPNTGNPYNAAIDAGKNPSLTVVTGSAGTADTLGTAETMRVGGNPVTGAIYVQDLSGASGTTNITGTVVVSNAEKGTITKVEGGTIGEVSNLAKGTVTRLELGTVTGVTANAALFAGNPIAMGGTDGGGTVRAVFVSSGGNMQVVPVSLPSSGTLLNLAKGTITRVEGGTLGEVTLVPTVSNLTNGSVNLLTGTVTRVLNVGTLESGTVKIDPTPIPATLTFGTLGTAGGSFFATISGTSGAGTKHYVTGVDVVMQSGTADVRVLAGSSIQGTGVLGAGFFPSPGGGISNRFTPAFATGTNSEIIYHFVGAGTAFIRVSYWKGV